MLGFARTPWEVTSHQDAYSATKAQPLTVVVHGLVSVQHKRIALTCVVDDVRGIRQEKSESNLPAKIWIWSAFKVCVVIESASMMVMSCLSIENVKFGSHETETRRKR